VKDEMIRFRCDADLVKALREAAKRSGWTVSEQIRFELLQLRGMWPQHEPYMPQACKRKASA
jgi:hypothetical protein